MLIDAPMTSGARVSASVHMGDGRQGELRWELPNAPGPAHVDALLPAALPLAMRVGESLRLPAPISPRLLGAAETIQDIFACWGEHVEIETGAPALFRRVPVEATSRAEVVPAGDGVACFFTAGVDSFYSALQHRSELTELVYVHGFDVGLDDLALRERVSAGVREAAAMLDLPLLEVHADVRGLSDTLLDWADYHGAALASVALLLADRFRRIYVPSTMTYAVLIPLGSHPIVDPLWSTERLELVHDGSEATRRQKLRSIARSEAARRWLRVCWENRDGAYNCGRCEKCVRTLVELRLLGLSSHFASFPELDLDDVGRAPIEFGGMGWREALYSAQESGHDPQLTQALRNSLRRHRLVRPGSEERPSRVSDSRIHRLELLASVTATAAERDRLAARLVELDGQLAAIRATRAWRATTRARRTRVSLWNRLGRGA